MLAEVRLRLIQMGISSQDRFVHYRKHGGFSANDTVHSHHLVPLSQGQVWRQTFNAGWSGRIKAVIVIDTRNKYPDDNDWIQCEHTDLNHNWVTVTVTEPAKNRAQILVIIIEY